MRVARNFYPHIGERQSWNSAGNAADLLSVEQQLIPGSSLAVDFEHAQPAIHLASIALSRDRLLARIATFAEADVRFVEARFCGQDAIVDLSAPARDARLDPPALELLLINFFARRPLVKYFFAAEDQPRLVLLGLDLRFRGEAHPDKLRASGLSKLRLSQEQKVIGGTPDDPQWRDHLGLRSEQQGLATLANSEGVDIIRDHPLQIVGSVGPGNAQRRAGEACNGR